MNTEENVHSNDIRNVSDTQRPYGRWRTDGSWLLPHKAHNPGRRSGRAAERTKTRHQQAGATTRGSGVYLWSRENERQETTRQQDNKTKRQKNHLIQKEGARQEGVAKGPVKNKRRRAGLAHDRYVVLRRSQESSFSCSALKFPSFRL